MFFSQVYLTILILNLIFVLFFYNLFDVKFSFLDLALEVFGLDKLVHHLITQVPLYFFPYTAAYFLILLLDPFQKLFFFLFLELGLDVYLKLFFDLVVNIHLNVSHVHCLF